MDETRSTASGEVTGDVVLDDNLTVMRRLPSECIDLIYLDPPFGTGQNRRLQSIRTGHGEKTRSGFGGRTYNFVQLSDFPYHRMLSCLRGHLSRARPP